MINQIYSASSGMDKVTSEILRESSSVSEWIVVGDEVGTSVPFDIAFVRRPVDTASQLE